MIPKLHNLSSRGLWIVYYIRNRQSCFDNHNFINDRHLMGILRPRFWKEDKSLSYAFTHKKKTKQIGN